MQDQYLPSGTGDDSLDTPVDLNAAQPVQHFAFGGIANPSQQAFLRGSDRRYLEARQAELDAFEQQRQAYNTALTTWQNEVYNPYVEQVNAYNTAAQKYNTDVYDPYKAQVEAYNQALTQYNTDVYDPYVQQYNAYERAINEWNAGPRTSDYAGPAAPTLAREFGMTVPVQPEAFSMTAPTAPKDFEMAAPTLPFKEEDVIAYQQSAAQRAQKDAGQRALAIDVVSDPSKYNFGSMSVANRFMAKGGPVEKTAREMMDDMDGQQQDRLFERMLSEVESGSKMPRDRILQMVEQVAQAGRGGDELLAYLSPESMAALKRMGGAGTINPATGLPEFKGGVLGRIFGKRTAAPAQAAAPEAPKAELSAAEQLAALQSRVNDLDMRLRETPETIRVRRGGISGLLGRRKTVENPAYRSLSGELRTARQQLEDLLASQRAATPEPTPAPATPPLQTTPLLGGPVSPGVYPNDFVGPLPPGSVRESAVSPGVYPNDFVGPIPAGSTREGEGTSPPVLRDAIDLLRQGKQDEATNVLRQIVGLEPSPVAPTAPAPPAPPVVRDQINPVTGIAQPRLGTVSPGDAGFVGPIQPTPGSTSGFIQRNTSEGFAPISDAFLRDLRRMQPAPVGTPGSPPDDSGNWRRAGPDEFGHFGIGLPGEMRNGYIRTGSGSTPVQPMPVFGGGAGSTPGGISINPISMPTMGQPGLSTPQPREREQATNPSNYFASQPAFQGVTPGTISAPYNPLAMNQMPSPQALIYNNPNLSPTMLGGQQNAGMMTDRLGNRIYAPGTPPFGFAKGGEVNAQDLVFTPVGGPPKPASESAAMLQQMPVASFAAGGSASRLTPEIARDLMVRSMTTGAPTSEFNRYGGYSAVAAMYNNSGGTYSLNDIPQSQLQSLANTVANTGVGNLSILAMTGTKLTPQAVQKMQDNGIDASTIANAVQTFGVQQVQGAQGQRASTISGVAPAANWTNAPAYSGASNTGVSAYQGPRPTDMDALLRSMPGANWWSTPAGARDTTFNTIGSGQNAQQSGSGSGINVTGPVMPTQGQFQGPSGNINITGPAMPTIGAFGPIGTAREQLASMQPNVSGPPGTIYPNQNVVAPGWMENLMAGVPGTIRPPGFAKGGEADIAAMRALVDASNMAEDEEEPINTDPVGTAQSMLSDLMASETPKTRTISRVSKMPVGGGADRPKGMAVEYESLTTAKAAKPKGAKSAQAELRALAKSYQLKKQAAENAAKGLMSNTLGAPTLERPTLEQETLTKRRFAKGGEAKKADAEEVEEPSLFGVSDYATKASARMFPNQMGQDDQRDAARHMLAAATVARKYGPKAAELLGKAHEYTSNPRTFFSLFGLEKPRDDFPYDMHNNQVGMELGARATSQADLERLVAQMARQASFEQTPGKPWIMSPERMEERKQEFLRKQREMQAQDTLEGYKRGGAVKRVA